MFLWNEKNLAQALALKIDSKFETLRINTDSRKIEKGDIFVALKGENFDGNKFAEEALKKGAIACIVDDTNLKNEKFILVADGLKALQKIGKYRRRNSKTKFVAITGSVGKTSTKEMIHAILASKYKSYKTEGNFNNHIGLPLTLANMPDDIEYAVIEMGMNHAGEIAELVRIGNPDIAAITWVGESHIENLGSRKNIAYAKAEIFEWLTQNGSAVIPADNDFYELLQEVAEKNAVNNIFAFGNKVNSVNQKANGCEAFIGEENIFIKNSILENHILNNILLAITVANICGISPSDSVKALEKLEAVKGRGKKIKLKNGVTLIDDSYNASPTSMKLALDKLGKEKAKRKIAALGIMKELGEFSKKYHEELAEHIAGIDTVLTCGKDMKFLHDKIKNNPSNKHFEDINALQNYIDSELKPDDLILLKGSHGSNIYKIAEKLSQE
jgi:UDP-N-acetylmuramoyl-tripeptide--D-alanyl-D-alanine ligase